MAVEGGGRISDRRILQIVRILRIVAVTQGHDYVSIPDLFVMAYCCWKCRDEWNSLSKWWLFRLSEVLRGLSHRDKDKHDPRKHMWLVSFV